MSKQIHFEISRCSSCPFAVHEQRELQVTQDGQIQKLIPAWYCMHPANRFNNDMARIVSENEMMVDGTWTLTEYCQKHTGTNFPDICPLPDRISNSNFRHTGKRRIEL
jgi:hypothetical protein